MNISIEKNNDVVTIKVVGRLDTITAPDLESVIKELKEKKLILDFEELEYVSSAGLRVLLGAHKRFSKGGNMKLINLKEQVLEIFEITGFVDILNIE